MQPTRESLPVGAGRCHDDAGRGRDAALSGEGGDECLPARGVVGEGEGGRRDGSIVGDGDREGAGSDIDPDDGGDGDGAHGNLHAWR
jgi:hypothetical protein